MSSTPIRVESVYKSFLEERNPSLVALMRGRVKRLSVLEDISFSVEKGSMLGVMGKNGAGKSTLLRLIGGVYGHDSGKITTEGDIVAIFEMGTFFNPELTGERYCQDYLRFRGLSGAALESAVEEIRQFTGLGNFFHEPVRVYSSGMQAKLLFAVATAVPAKVVLVDEVLVVGDEYFQAKAWRRMKDLLTAGATGIIVSHDWTSLFKLCRRVLVLADKRVSFIGDTAEGIRKYLNIPPSSSEEAMILDKEELRGKPVVRQSGEPFKFSFRIGLSSLFCDDVIGISFSIERQEFGVGLSVVMTGNYNFSPDTDKTTFEVTISIADFCLAPGEYCLSLFLSSQIKDAGSPVDKGYDQMAWSTGNYINLIVEGENPSLQTLRKRMTWKQTSL